MNHAYDRLAMTSIQRAAIPYGKNKRDTTMLFIGLSYLAFNYTLPVIKIYFSYYEYIGKFIGLIMIFGIMLVPRYRSIALQRRHVYYAFAAVVTIFASTLLNGDELEAVVNGVYDVMSCLAAYLFFMGLTRKDANAKLVICIFGILALGNGLVGIYGSLTGNSLFGMSSEYVGVGAFGYDPSSGRSGGIRGENYVGVWNVPALALGLSLFFSSTNIRRRSIGIFIVCLSSASILVSLSRSSIISGITTAIVGLILYAGRGRMKTILLTIFIACLVVLISQFFLGQQRSFFSKQVDDIYMTKWTFQALQEESRPRIWKEYWEDLLESPILGKGVGYIKEQVSRGRFVPHNSFLSITVEQGIIGLLLYILPFIMVIRSLRIYIKRQDVSDDYGKVACMSFFAIAAGLLFLSDPFIKILWVVAGILQGRTLLMTKTNT